MNVIETIRSEINRRKELHDSKAFKTESDMIANLEIGAAQALDDILLFLSDLESEKPFKEPIDGVLYAVACGIKNKGQIEKPEKPLRADLEEASDEYAEKHGFRVPYDGSDNFYDDVDVKASKEGFIAGAKWMAEHLKK